MRADGDDDPTWRAVAGGLETGRQHHHPHALDRRWDEVKAAEHDAAAG